MSYLPMGPGFPGLQELQPETKTHSRPATATTRKCLVIGWFLIVCIIPTLRGSIATAPYESERSPSTRKWQFSNPGSFRSILLLICTDEGFPLGGSGQSN